MNGMKTENGSSEGEVNYREPLVGDLMLCRPRGGPHCGFEGERYRVSETRFTGERGGEWVGKWSVSSERGITSVDGGALVDLASKVVRRGFKKNEVRREGGGKSDVVSERRILQADVVFQDWGEFKYSSKLTLAIGEESGRRVLGGRDSKEAQL